MLVTDRIESQYVNTATIVTSGCRLSSELLGHILNSRERSGRVYDKKPILISSRVSHSKIGHPWAYLSVHYPCSVGYTRC